MINDFDFCLWNDVIFYVFDFAKIVQYREYDKSLKFFVCVTNIKYIFPKLLETLLRECLERY